MIGLKWLEPLQNFVKCFYYDPVVGSEVAPDVKSLW